MKARTPPVELGRLILLPALFSLMVTILRLTGELNNWSPAWFSKDTGGSVPSGMSWVVGITWLAIPFGAWFAVKLHQAGEQPARPLRAIGLALAALVLFYAAPPLLLPRLPLPFPERLLVIWSIALVAAAVAWSAWPSLARILAAYGFLARLPVAVVMALAMLGSWRTHYDYVDFPRTLEMSFWPRYLWLAFFPQLIFWVGYTVMIGSLSGIAAALFMRGRSR